MNPIKQVYRADEFPAGVRISIHGVPSMSNMLLEAVTPSCVHVVNNGAHTTISCGSPCFASDEEIIQAVMDSGPVVAPKVEPIRFPSPEETVVKEKHSKPGRPQGIQGKIIADKLEAFVFPTEPFTIRKLVELTGVDQLHLIAFIKNKCKEVGEEEKVPGKRGRAAKLYLKK
jgi:hypothetical protein